MNFTREPLVETVITPKDGYKLVVRSSKGGGQEEFFVDAVEVISFGHVSFFRSLEKPKCFLVPVSDYEILEVRESRMVLKTSGTERGIKIGGGREVLMKASKEETPVAVAVPEVEASTIDEQRADKRRERRRYRKRRGKNEMEEESAEPQEIGFSPEEPKEKRVEKPSLIPPPSTLISETITRYKVPAVEDSGIEEREFRPITPPPPRIVKEEPNSTEEEDEEIPF